MPTSTRVVHRARPARRFIPHYIAISPYYIFFLIFGFIPVIFSMGLAFTRWNGLGRITFAGLDQFAFLFQDKTFKIAVVNTFIIWIFSTVPMLCMSLVIAAVLNSVKRFKVLYQAILFLPSITSIVAVVVFFRAIFDQGYGVANQLFAALGLPAVAWFENPWAIKALLSILMTWQWVGYNAIIYSAGLSAVPRDLYEAAQLDGANAWQTFRYVTVPMLRPVVLFTVVMSTITGMQSFTEPQVMFATATTQNNNSGGPGNAGLTMVLYFYREAFNNNDYGYGSAIAWAVFAIVGVFTLINWKLVSRGEDR